MNNCIADETTLSKKFGTDIPMLRAFSLETFGVQRESFLRDMRPTFSVLHLDPYDAKRNKVDLLKKRFPRHADRLNGFLSNYYANKEDLAAVYDIIKELNDADRNELDRIGMTGRRKRSVARFNLTHGGGGKWNLERVPARQFRQNVAAGDPRALVRIFHEMEALVTEHPQVRHLMQCFAELVRERHPDCAKLRMNVHQMFIFADILSGGDNAPEGIHQDGADYIVSALVIERAGIVGGESIVYAPDKKTEYFRRTLAEGEGLFQSDRGLWHYVTQIRENPAVPPDYGHRSILGFDMDIVA
ncbi:MAG TPA: 2OG-Fe dioxygenase family protein [Verrucomicrobiae bacterium]|jgi:hypothetical protein